jgi:hypothetical protein
MGLERVHESRPARACGDGRTRATRIAGRRSTLLALLVCLSLSTGCAVLPEVVHQPTVHNPFPQLHKVAVAPFFNLSMEPTLDGRAVAAAYFQELQSVPGFQVVPVSVVETTMINNRIPLNSPEDARRLAQLLQVDAVVVGSITDFTPYYPPRMALHVEWYTANPGFHPIPPGYGLPWGTQEEQQIPRSLVFEAEFALAQAQLQTQTPQPPPGAVSTDTKGDGKADPKKPGAVQAMSAVQPVDTTSKDGTSATSGGNSVALAATPNRPAGWPDPRGFIPPPPQPNPPPYRPSDAPVLRHTKTYMGNDADFTAALASYYGFRDEARLDGWQGYLQRSEDFTRFCCRMHIWEMLTARGGAGESRVVWRWPSIR